jgi:hypothetical protein
MGKFVEGTRLIAAARSKHDVVRCLKTFISRAGVKIQWSHSTHILYYQQRELHQLTQLRPCSKHSSLVDVKYS